jgi:hypothetical protein
MREIKFRSWNGSILEYSTYNNVGMKLDLWITLKFTLMQYVGLKDKNEKEYYVGDIGRFDNGDTFILRMEDHLEVYVDWIGDPECEDQARDLYRIESAEIIGNDYENPELLVVG